MARGAAARRRRSIKRAQARAARTGLGEARQRGDIIETLDRRREQRAELAAAGSASLPLGPRDAKWDGAAAAQAVAKWASSDGSGDKDKIDWGKYAQAFFYKDASDGPAENVGDYKLGFAEPVNGTLTANWGGITAVAGVLSGARGGVQIPDADKTAIKGKVKSWYAKAAKQYKDDGIKVPWEADSSSGETAAFLLARAELGTVDEALLAVAAAGWEQAFQPMPDCAGCGHAFADHLGDTGPCTDDGCDCTSYDEPDADDEAAVEAEGFSSIAHALAAPIDWEPVLSDLVAQTVERTLERIYLGPNQASTVTLQLTDFDVVDTTLPDQHRPGERIPRRRPTPRPPAAPPAGASMTWSAVFAPEGKLTSDGRAIAPGALTWRQLPLTLMAMTETSEGGHIGAEVCGRIDKIWRDEQAGVIRASGVFDDGDYGREIAGLVADETLRGVSVDLAISKYDTGPRSDWFDEQGDWIGVMGDDGEWHPAAQDGQDAEPPSILDLYGEDTIAVILAAEIGMTTVCPFPAFADARIAMGDSLVAGGNPAFWTVTQQGGWTVEGAPVFEDCGCDDVVTAAAAGLAPTAPPAEWFADPGLDGPTAITVTDEGRLFGHAAAWGVCHIGLPGCRTAPHSASGYRYFHLGEVACDGGGRVACGQVTLDTGHADRSLDAAAATRHYDDTGTVVAHVVCGEDEHGIWVAGALQPDAPEEKVRLLAGSKLSGDWRKIDGSLELVALLAVNVPGFPVPRARALVASGDGEEPEVVSLVAAGIPVFRSELTAEELERFAALAEYDAFAALAGREG